MVLTATSVVFAGQETSGKQLMLKDPTVGVSGLWNWIAANDNLDIGTEMVPDSGTSPLFAKEDGSIFAEATMKIGPEPVWTPEAADTLKYPSASIEVRFKKEGCVQGNSCGVNFKELGIKYVRIKLKVSGRIRMSVLNEKTAEPGAEPGVYLPNSSGYQTTTYDLTPFEFGFKGFDDRNYGGVFDWVNLDKAPEGSEIIQHVTGLRWEIRAKEGATGKISIESIEFLDAFNNTIETSLLTGVTGVRTNINDPLDNEIANGKQQAIKDSTVGVSGLWNWIAANDKLDIGTEMAPDSGTSPLFVKEDGSIFAEAAMKIGPEPEWTQEAADAGTLKYPFAYIEMRFKKDECVQDNSCGVDLSALGIRYIRIRAKVSGPIRMYVLNEKTIEKDAEPGVYLPNSSGYQTTTYDLTPFEFGFKGFDDNNFGGIPVWINYDKAPEGSEIIQHVTGLRWELRTKEGGIGKISIKSIEFLDANKKTIKTSLLTGVTGVRTNINDPLHNEIAKGKQQTIKDSTVGISGLWNWIAVNDNLNIGTEMVPDSGTSPLFVKEDGSIFAEAAMKIGPEPVWTQEAADAGTLKYPFAAIEMRFKKDECVQDSSCGVDLSALGIKYIHIRSKTFGPIRMSVLNEKTPESGAEPGVLIPNSSEYMSILYDLTPFEFGFKGFDDNNFGGIPVWINYDKAPLGSEIIKHVTGLRWEISDSHGASGEISIKSIEFLDELGNVIDAFNLTGVEGVRSVIESSSSVMPESSSSSVMPESSSSSVMPESSSSSVIPESSSSSVIPESSSSSVKPKSSSSVVKPESSSSAVKPKSSSSAVKPKSSSSAVKPKSSSSAVKPKSSSSAVKPKSSSSAVKPKSSSSAVKPKSSSSAVKPKSSSSRKSKSSSSAAPKSSSSSSKKKNALPQKHFTSMAHITVSGKQILISNATPGSDYAVFTMQGKVIKAGKIQNRVENITLENQGAFLVRVGHEIFKVK